MYKDQNPTRTQNEWAMRQLWLIHCAEKDNGCAKKHNVVCKLLQHEYETGRYRIPFKSVTYNVYFGHLDIEFLVNNIVVIKLTPDRLMIRISESDFKHIEKPVMYRKLKIEHGSWNT